MNKDRENGAELRAFLDNDPAGPDAARGNRGLLASFEASKSDITPALRERAYGRVRRQLPFRRGWLLAPVAAAAGALLLLRGVTAPSAELSPDERAYYNYPQFADDAATELLGERMGLTPDCPGGGCGPERP